MNGCGDRAVETGVRSCGTCAERGSRVRLTTVKALLTEIALRRIQQTQYWFCGNASCKTVYFGNAGDRFGVDDIRVRVWQKQSDGERLLCYCFGETESGIRNEVVDGGRTDVVARIRDHVAAQRCACELRNPRGACCLGDVIAAVERIGGISVAVKEK